MTLIVAEAGINHGGNLKVAKRLIRSAKWAGADIVKFQTFDPEKLEPPGPRRSLLEKHYLPHKDFLELAAHAESAKIEFMSTPFDVGSLEFLVERVGVKKLKIASGNLYNHDLLKAAADSGLTVFLSTGMAGNADIRQAVEFLDLPLDRLVLLQCTSAYPAPLGDINLRVIPKLREDFGYDAGLSDHSQNLVVPIAAAALGAAVIERHLMLSDTVNAPDYTVSLTPMVFWAMVKQIRDVETALGNSVKRRRPSESEISQIIDEREKHRCAS